MQTACGITDQHIGLAGFGCCHRIINDRCWVRALLLCDDFHPGAVCPLRQLLNCCRTEGISRCQNDLLALILQLACQLTDGSGLADTVNPNHEHYGFAVLKLVGILAKVHLFPDGIDQKLFAFSRFLDMLFFDFFS